MMTYKVFEGVIENLREHDDFERKCSSGIALMNSSYTVLELAPALRAALKSLLQDIFTKEGEEHIEWWMYEKPLHEGPWMWDKDGNEIPMKTIRDLYNYLVETYGGTRESEEETSS